MCIRFCSLGISAVFQRLTENLKENKIKEMVRDAVVGWGDGDALNILMDGTCIAVAISNEVRSKSCHSD